MVIRGDRWPVWLRDLNCSLLTHRENHKVPIKGLAKPAHLSRQVSGFSTEPLPPAGRLGAGSLLPTKSPSLTCFGKRSTLLSRWPGNCAWFPFGSSNLELVHLATISTIALRVPGAVG